MVVSDNPAYSSSPFVSGDRVRVQLEVEIFKMLQEGHGGWNDQMAEVSESTFGVSVTPQSTCTYMC